MKEERLKKIDKDVYIYIYNMLLIIMRVLNQEERLDLILNLRS
jgi:hypothetical protein